MIIRLLESISINNSQKRIMIDASGLDAFLFSSVLKALSAKNDVHYDSFHEYL
jgi:hypothetical protein